MAAMDQRSMPYCVKQANTYNAADAGNLRQAFSRLYHCLSYITYRY